jgi:hypothetical protein
LNKEKQMADFRRYLTVLAVLALMAGAASAQIGVANGSASTLLGCNASAAAIPELRPEGYTELVGDIVITCTGGPIYAVGSIIPTTNITVSISPGAPITSRYMSAGPGNGFSSDVLLLIDEPGSTVASGVTGAYGPRAPQTLCNTTQQTAANNTSCPAIVGVDNGYLVSTVSGTGSANSTNVYQGRVNAELGPQSVTFYNVPVLPPATTGVSRTYRITNIRVPVAGGGSIPSSSLAFAVSAVIVTGANTALPISQTQVTVAVVGKPLSAAVAKPTALTQCANPGITQTSTLTFTEGFATAFKTRVVPGGALNLTPLAATNTPWAGQATNLIVGTNNQNIPGGLYGGFAQGSESGFIFSALNGGTAGVSKTAGLADFGTRLKAVFYNIPAGLTLYVSNTALNTAPSVLGGTSMSPYAVLVATNSGEATSDGSAFGATNVIGGSSPTQVAISADSTGKAVAVWEVINANPAANDVLTFGVYVAYTAAAATTNNPYGTPITDLSATVPVPGQPVNDVQLSFAPEPGGGTFTAAAGPVGGTDIPIPRFVVASTFEGKYITITPCSTSLLYPYITGAAGFDSGISVANTSWDPFSTAKQAGSCTLYAYGVTVAAAGNTAVQTVISGCDTIPNALEGTNCFGVVPAGQVKSVMASAVLPNFQGYVIALCNFQYAHGYAAVTDLGLRNLWSSYLALELNNAVGGSKRGSGIEVLGN